jgi:hypothetical protein
LLTTLYHLSKGPPALLLKSLGIGQNLGHVSVMEKTIAMSMVVVLATFCGAYALHVWKR